MIPPECEAWNIDVEKPFFLTWMTSTQYHLCRARGVSIITPCRMVLLPDALSLTMDDPVLTHNPPKGREPCPICKKDAAKWGRLFFGGEKIRMT